MSEPSESTRKIRADAQRNRDRLLETARLAFARDGVDASLDEIAKTSGVGSGTLYRHFPTRLDLIKAVYWREVLKLEALGEEYAATKPPLDALRSWMLTFVDHVLEKRLIASALDEAAYAEAAVIIQRIAKKLTQRGIDSGDLRADTMSIDLILALIGTLNMGQHDAGGMTRFVDILLRGVCQPGALEKLQIVATRGGPGSASPATM